MSEYLEDLWIAFKWVDTIYFDNLALNHKEEVYSQYPENNFTSEIVRHYRNIMECKSCEYSDLIFQMDLRKSRQGLMPDLVLHKGNDNQSKQQICAEVKIFPNAQLKYDLLKLLTAISHQLNFDEAVLIVVNKPLENTLMIVRKFIADEKLSQENMKKLYLFHAIKKSKYNICYTRLVFDEI
jgi:hypothetical protein